MTLFRGARSDEKTASPTDGKPSAPELLEDEKLDEDEGEQNEIGPLLELLVFLDEEKDEPIKDEASCIPRTSFRTFRSPSLYCFTFTWPRKKRTNRLGIES